MPMNSVRVAVLAAIPVLAGGHSFAAESLASIVARSLPRLAAAPSVPAAGGFSDAMLPSPGAIAARLSEALAPPATQDSEFRAYDEAYQRRLLRNVAETLAQTLEKGRIDARDFADPAKTSEAERDAVVAEALTRRAELANARAEAVVRAAWSAGAIDLASARAFAADLRRLGEDDGFFLTDAHSRGVNKIGDAVDAQMLEIALRDVQDARNIAGRIRETLRSAGLTDILGAGWGSPKWARMRLGLATPVPAAAPASGGKSAALKPSRPVAKASWKSSEDLARAIFGSFQDMNNFMIIPYVTESIDKRLWDIRIVTPAVEGMRHSYSLATILPWDDNGRFLVYLHSDPNPRVEELFARFRLVPILMLEGKSRFFLSKGATRDGDRPLPKPTAVSGQKATPGMAAEMLAYYLERTHDVSFQSDSDSTEIVLQDRVNPGTNDIRIETETIKNGEFLLHSSVEDFDPAHFLALNGVVAVPQPKKGYYLVLPNIETSDEALSRSERSSQ